MDLATAREHIGDYVLYRAEGSEPETGVIVNAGGPFVAVLYRGQVASNATRPEDLTLLTGRCPDRGTCHHGCGAKCFRVQWAGPLSGVFPGDRWPAEVLAANSGELDGGHL